MTYDQFLEKIGKPFEKANRPRNWLGGEVVEFVFLHLPCKTDLNLLICLLGSPFP
jgi:hypothetical protein